METTQYLNQVHVLSAIILESGLFTDAENDEIINAFGDYMYGKDYAYEESDGYKIEWAVFAESVGRSVDSQYYERIKQAFAPYEGWKFNSAAGQFVPPPALPNYMREPGEQLHELFQDFGKIFGPNLYP